MRRPRPRAVGWPREACCCGARSVRPPSRLAVTRRAGSIGAAGWAGPASGSGGVAVTGAGCGKIGPVTRSMALRSHAGIPENTIESAHSTSNSQLMVNGERRHTGQLAPLEPFEEGTARGRDVAEATDDA